MARTNALAYFSAEAVKKWKSFKALTPCSKVDQRNTHNDEIKPAPVKDRRFSVMRFADDNFWDDTRAGYDMIPDMITEAVCLVICERVMNELDTSYEWDGHELFLVFLVPREQVRPELWTTLAWTLWDNCLSVKDLIKVCAQLRTPQKVCSQVGTNWKRVVNDLGIRLSIQPQDSEVIGNRH